MNKEHRGKGLGLRFVHALGEWLGKKWTFAAICPGSLNSELRLEGRADGDEPEGLQDKVADQLTD